MPKSNKNNQQRTHFEDISTDELFEIFSEQMIEDFASIKKDTPTCVKCGNEITREYKNGKLVLNVDKISIGTSEKNDESLLEIEAG